MKSIFSNNYYGLIIKELRVKKKLNLSSLEKITGVDTAAISRLETGSQLPIEKYELLFDYFNIDKDFIDKAENELSSAFIQFMQAIIDISPNVKKYYLDLQNNFEEYKNSIFSFIFELSNLIYSNFNRNYKIFNYQTILNNIDFLTDEYQSYAYIYVAEYLTKQSDKNNAKQFYEQAQKKSNHSIQAKAFLSYFLSSYYLLTNDYFQSLKHLENSSNLFLELQNYNRLINLNIRKGNQLRHIHLFQKALENDLSALINIENYPHLDLEKYSLINNVGWTYLLMENYHSALKYIEMIPSEMKKCNHFFDQAICHIMLQNDNEALKICSQNIKAIPGEQLDYDLLDWLKQYLQDKQNKKNTAKYKKIYDQHKNQLSNLDCEYYLKLLKHFHIKQKRYKSATNIALEIMNLQNN